MATIRLRKTTYFVSTLFASLGLLFLATLTACDQGSPNLHPGAAGQSPIIVFAAGDGDVDSPLKLVGERFFRENRFSQYFYTHNAGKLTQVPAVGDPVVNDLIVVSIQNGTTIENLLPHPYRGQAMSCAACHFVEQAEGIAGTPGTGSRAYTDFAHRSPIPDRGDGQTTTVRNSPNMVSMVLHDGMSLHHDGEFSTAVDLVVAGYTGRNMGWLVGEDQTAIHHIANIVRNDDGSYPTETGLGGLSYKDLLIGAPNIPAIYQIPPQYHLDITKATDQQIFDAVVNLVAGYLGTLNYTRDPVGQYTGSPYEAFLVKNGLPKAGNTGESDQAYSQRLGQLLQKLTTPAFVSDADGQFTKHVQHFTFDKMELQGAQIFFGRGQCIQCHAAPDFTDHLFHNTGASQDEYDSVHGAGSFAKLQIPTLKARNAQAGTYLPAAAPNNMNGLSLARSIPDKNDARKMDLGAWVTFGNPNMPKPQALLRQLLCQSRGLDCTKATDEQISSIAVGAVKTPSVRDLGHSEPYLHTGQATQIEDVMKFYIKYSAMAQAGQVLNADPKLAKIQLTSADVDAVTAFLKSLNQDYQ